MAETLGVVAHRGGLVVERPELTVGVVSAVSRPGWLELELLARRPLDRRSGPERQADIRAGRAGPVVAPRRLLPQYDEGLELRVGWLDDGGRAHWEYGSWSSSSGDHFEGVHGPSLRTTLRFPPLFDRVGLVLAWPELGFAEAVVELPLPDRATVERETVSIWDAPVRARRPAEPLTYRDGDSGFDPVPVEAGRIVAGPQVLSRAGGAAVVLTRVTAVGEVLALEINSVAAGAGDDSGQGAAVAVLRDGEAVRVRPGDGGSSGGAGVFRSTFEFTLPRPGGDTLDLVVEWPAAGLPEMYAEIPLSPR